ncbi:aspartic peptidase domain-containing protein, partial [Emericellopsis atlantica]
MLDTSSSETLVNPNCQKSDDPVYCTSTGRFTSSSSFVDLNTQGGTTLSGGYVEWNYGFDYMGLGSARIGTQIFGVAYDSEGLSAGVLALAPSLAGWDSPYPFVVDALYYQGFTQSRAFSLDLRSGDSEGSLTLGGLDTSRYTGNLEKLPIIPSSQSPDGNTRYWVQLDKLAGDDLIFYEGQQAFVLDSSDSVCRLPSPIFNSLMTAFPSAIFTPSTNQYSVDCADREAGGTLDFTFGTTTIKVPISEFIVESDGVCYIGATQDDNVPALGTNFLSSAYVVFDQDNRSIHIGQNCQGDYETNLVAIGSGPDAVPSPPGTFSSPVSSPASSPASSPTSSPASTPVSTLSPTSITTTAASTSHTSPSAVTSVSDETSSSTQVTSQTTISTSQQTQETTQSTQTDELTSRGTSTTVAPESHITTTTPQVTTQTYLSTTTYVVTKCPPTFDDCPFDEVTTEVLTLTTTYCPAATATHTLTH